MKSEEQVNGHQYSETLISSDQDVSNSQPASRLLGGLVLWTVDAILALTVLCVTRRTMILIHHLPIVRPLLFTPQLKTTMT